VHSDLFPADQYNQPIYLIYIEDFLFHFPDPFSGAEPSAGCMSGSSYFLVMADAFSRYHFVLCGVDSDAKII
jgi:hypothetical protein